MIPSTRFVSLWEMLETFGMIWHQLGFTIAGVECVLKRRADAGEPLEEIDLQIMNQQLHFIEFMAKLHGLATIPPKVERFRIRLKPQSDPSVLADLLGKMNEDLSDELRGRMFYYVNPVNAERYEKPLATWTEVVAKFDVAIDVEESEKCAAVGRHTASVFHLMRVVEVGLRALGASLNDESLNPKLNPTWDRILSRCDSELKKPYKDRGPEWRSDEQFFSAATATLRAVKDAWRNPSLHVEKDYNEEQAADVRQAVRAFMRQLATKLGRVPTDASDSTATQSSEPQ
jgi:hypothetical protein